MTPQPGARAPTDRPSKGGASTDGASTDRHQVTLSGRARTVVSGIDPWIDGGRTMLKRVVGDMLVVEADVFADGHDLVAAQLRCRFGEHGFWQAVPMVPIGNDRFRASVRLEEIGLHFVEIAAHVDPWASWRRALRAKATAQSATGLDLLVGADVLAAAAGRLGGSQRNRAAAGADHLRRLATRLPRPGTLLAGPPESGGAGSAASGTGSATGAPGPVAGGPGLRHPLRPDGPLSDLTGDSDSHKVGDGDRTHGDRTDGNRTDGQRDQSVVDAPWLAELDPLLAAAPDPDTVTTAMVGQVWVDRALAGSAAWYELFPRSASPDPKRPGTLIDVIDRLPYVAGLGFDILYLPPVHPIGRTHRKGRNGAPVAAADEPGSPWAIGATEGGHTAVHPDLGTIGDLRRLVTEARRYGLEVALDLAFQCSPDHPWVGEHPEWFRALPDGTIAYAENPPKRYEDIYPLDFDCADWQGLWEALAGVVRFWIDQGVTVFRVDNPHTKPLVFWEWLVATVHDTHPQVILLAEAFTRPRLLERLAKIGFTQSYTYFTWRVAKWEIEQYLTELTTTDTREYLRPNFWPNTPDILPEHLQTGGRAAFVARLVLAATGSATYGIYGPAFELQEHLPRGPGSEEYLDSEKYRIRHWDLDRHDSLADVVSSINHMRREHPALRQNRNLVVLPTDNDQLVAFAKWDVLPGAGELPAHSDEVPDIIVTVVNLDPRSTQSGWVDVDPARLGLPADEPFTAEDLLTGSRFSWQGRWNYVALVPEAMPAHVLHLRRTEPRP